MQQEIKKSVTAYLASLVWDGTPRISRWLIDYAGAEDTAAVREASRDMLIAAVRRARKPGSAFDKILVLEGPQGCGKSAALRVLAVDETWFSDDVPVGGTAREIVEATAGKWIVELPVFGHLEAKTFEVFKAFMNCRADVVRGPYQLDPSHFPRQFVCVGTAQELGLPEPTGNRRFCPVRIECFDIERLRSARDQLWAEAVAAEGAGRWAFVVIHCKLGAEFSSVSLDAACAYVTDKLRAEVLDTTLINSSSYRIKRVKAG